MFEIHIYHCVADSDGNEYSLLKQHTRGIILVQLQSRMKIDLLLVFSQRSIQNILQNVFKFHCRVNVVKIGENAEDEQFFLNTSVLGFISNSNSRLRINNLISYTIRYRSRRSFKLNSSSILFLAVLAKTFDFISKIVQKKDVQLFSFPSPFVCRTKEIRNWLNTWNN